MVYHHLPNVSLFWDHSQDMSSRGFPPKKPSPLIGWHLIYQLESCFLAGNQLNSCPESWPGSKKKLTFGKNFLFFLLVAYCVGIRCSNEIILKLINEQNSWGLGTHLPAENMVSKDNLLHIALTTFQTNSQSNGKSILSGTLLQKVLQMCKIGYYWLLYKIFRVQSCTSNRKAWFRYPASLVRKFWEM